MKIFVGRHAYAGDPSDDPKKERERPLTPEGVKMAKAIAQTVLDGGDVPSAIFSSPFARAVQTADIYGKCWGVQVNVVGTFAPMRPLEDEIMNMISSDKLKRIMIVAHVDNTTPAMRTFGGDVKWKPLVMAEVRRMKIDRDSGEWKLRWSLKPSDVGMKDYDS